MLHWNIQNTMTSSNGRADERTYFCTLETVMGTLAQHGVAIVPSVLNEHECAAMMTGAWDMLEHLTSCWPVPISRWDAATWKGFRDLFPTRSMLLQHFGVGHADFVWEVRRNPKCMEIFAKIWNSPVEDLLVSFDGMSFQFPPEITGFGFFKGQNWYHTDQNYSRNGFECVQGWVTGLDVGVGDATLAFYEGSHRYHGEFASRFSARVVAEKKDFYKLSEEEKAFYMDRGCTETFVVCPKGSLVLWDSRVIHCGVEARMGRAAANFRCIVYLCYMPRTMANEKELAKRRKAFEEGRMTTHWPCKVRLFGKRPQTYGVELAPVKALTRAVVRDEIMGRLVGY